MSAEETTTIVGVILPPRDIRVVVDKTANFVAKNGPAFELRIKNSAEGKTPKFSFLNPADPYHSYYKQKIKQLQEPEPELDHEDGSKEADLIKSSEVVVKTSTEAASSSSAILSAKPSFVSPLAKAAQVAPTEPPREIEFMCKQHQDISALDVDIIKLTAQYTAVNGRNFLADIASREQRNPQFDFLQPTSSFFGYFTSLVDQYTSIYSKFKDSQETLSDARNDQKRLHVLQRAVQRWTWNQNQKEAKTNETSLANIMVDWSKFSIVETISFEEVVSQVDTSSSVGDIYSSAVSSKAPIEQSVIQDDSCSDEDMDMDMDMDMEDDGEYEKESNFTVVDSYQPQLGATTSEKTTLLDPVSGRVIDASDVGEHMRVQLIDPRWRTEQQKFQDKQNETGYAEGDAITANLERFAKQRSDIFGKEKSDNSEVEGDSIGSNPAKRMKRES